MADVPQRECPFCHIDAQRIIHQNQHGFAVRDGFPVSPGHSLVILKRHVGSFFDLSREEQHALLDLLNETKQQLCHSEREAEESPPLSSRDSSLSSRACEGSPPSSFNIGINDGPAAGQTVAHCHIHLSPRYEGDVKDPRGGVRWILPEKADYWSSND